VAGDKVEANDEEDHECRSEAKNGNTPAGRSHKVTTPSIARNSPSRAVARPYPNSAPDVGNRARRPPGPPQEESGQMLQAMNDPSVTAAPLNATRADDLAPGLLMRTHH